MPGRNAEELDPHPQPRKMQPLPHLAIVVTIASALAASLKVYSFAHWDTYTVSTILMHQSFSGLFAIVLLVLLPVALAATLFMQSVSLGESIREEEPWRIEAVLCGLLAVGVVAFSPWRSAVPAIAVSGFLVTYALVVRLVRGRLERKGKTAPWLLRKGPLRPVPNVRVLTVGWVVFGILAVSVTDSGWMPKERLVLDQAQARVGYVLAVQGDHFVWVDDGDRAVDFIPTASLKDREPCSSPGRPLHSMLLWPSDGTPGRPC